MYLDDPFAYLAAEDNCLSYVTAKDNGLSKNYV